MSEFENNSHFAPSDGFNINELTGIDGKMHQQQLIYLLVFVIVVFVCGVDYCIMFSRCGLNFNLF